MISKDVELSKKANEIIRQIKDGNTSEKDKKVRKPTCQINTK